jgi:hypothetical protein
MRASALGRTVGLLALVVAAAGACSASENSDPPRGTNNGSGANGSGGTVDLGGNSTGASSSSGGSVGIGNSTGTGADSGLGGDNNCAGDVIESQLIPLDIYITLDSSGSMLEHTAAGPSKWSAIAEALEAFFEDESSAGIGVGLQFFPRPPAGVPESCTTNEQCGDYSPCVLRQCWKYSAPGMVVCETDQDCPGSPTCVDLAFCSGDKLYTCSTPGVECIDGDNNSYGTCTKVEAGRCLNATSCEVADYSTPELEIETLPEAAEALVDALDARDLDGQTPTAPALEAGILHAYEWAEDHPSHTVVHVFATDGIPSDCTTDIPSIAAIADDGHDGTPSIPTYVIGVFAPDSGTALDDLDTIAEAGGTEEAFVVDTSQDVVQQLLDAMNAVRASKLACEFQVPEAPAGETLAYDELVNVQFSVGGASETLPFVRTADQCGITQGGWYYDVDPDDAVPTKILVCPNTCQQFQDTPGGSVEIQLGCVTQETVVK